MFVDHKWNNLLFPWTKSWASWLWFKKSEIWENSWKHIGQSTDLVLPVERMKTCIDTGRSTDSSFRLIETGWNYFITATFTFQVIFNFSLSSNLSKLLTWAIKEKIQVFKLKSWKYLILRSLLQDISYFTWVFFVSPFPLGFAFFTNLSFKLPF